MIVPGTSFALTACFNIEKRGTDWFLIKEVGVETGR